MDLTTTVIPTVAGLVLETLGLRGASIAGVGASLLFHQALAFEHARYLHMPKAGHLAKGALGLLLITLATVTTMRNGGFGYWVTNRHNQ